MKREQNEPLVQHSRKWDRAGFAASALCLLHCLAGPILIVAYPSIGGNFFHRTLHLILLPTVMLFAFVSFFSSFKMHKNKGPILLGSLGISLLLLSYFGDEVFHKIDGFLPAVVGSVTLLFSHLWNIRACHCFCEHDCDHEAHDAPNKHAANHSH